MNDQPLATTVIKLLKQSINRIYIILIITIVVFLISVIDSIIQRDKLNEAINNAVCVESE